MSDDELYIEIRKPAGYVGSEEMLDALERLATVMASEGSDDVSGFALPSMGGGLDLGLRGAGTSNIVYCGEVYDKGTGSGGPKCSGGFFKFP